MEDYIVSQEGLILKVPLSSIYYVTTHPCKAHRLLIVVSSGRFETTLSLSEFAVASAGSLVRCHRKLLVNPSKIRGFHCEKRMILFGDDRISDILCSRRKFAAVKEEWKGTKGGRDEYFYSRRQYSAANTD